MQKRVDIIVFGATGYTGKFVVEHLARLTKKEYSDIIWGIAGRSKKKLEHLAQEINNTDYANTKLLIIESDIENEESLKKMTQMAKVVINCTGPNIILSPPIVKACIETKTHYVDISAEIFHILSLYRQYHKPAEDANVLVIPSCGYAAVPVEAGMIYLEKQFQGTLHSVDCYAELLVPNIGTAAAHSGTWNSLIQVLSTFREYLALKAEILPKDELEEFKRSFFFRNNGKLWFPWPGVENDTVKMSQTYLYSNSGKKPVHFNAYMTVQHYFQFMVIPITYLVYFLASFKISRKLLYYCIRLFSLGYMSEEGPTYQTRQNTKFYFLLNGNGWGKDGFNTEPKKTLSVKVSGQDPAVDCTALPAILCAITILKETSNMPKGGVLTPGAAFYETDLVNRLKNHGLTFEVLK